jgi:hypothetical protein
MHGNIIEVIVDDEIVDMCLEAREQRFGLAERDYQVYGRPASGKPRKPVKKAGPVKVVKPREPCRYVGCEHADPTRPDRHYANTASRDFHERDKHGGIFIQKQVPPPPKGDAATIRRWAREVGLDAGERGRIPLDVRERWEAAGRPGQEDDQDQLEVASG